MDAQRKIAIKVLDRWEETFRKTLARFFTRQGKVVVEKLRGSKARKGTRHWEGNLEIKKDLDAADVFDRDRWLDELRDEMAPLMEDLFDEAGSDVAEKLGVSFDVHNPKVEAAMALRVNRIVGANDTTYALIQRELLRGEAAGEAIPLLAARVESVFDNAAGYRSTMIARTEVASAVNGAGFLSAAASGFVTSKTWLATFDGRTRPEHADADGQTVGFDEPFDIGGEELEYPGDPNGSAAQTINCRCTTIFNQGDEE